VNKKRRTLLLLAVMVLATMILSGCMLPEGDVDLNNPSGVWNTLVYLVAKLLIALNRAIASLGIPPSWGWVIIIFPIAIKIVTLPLTLKQLQSTKAQQELQPRLRELQQKYGKDRQKLSEEQMKLYKESGINPLGGCLPLLIQMPVLFALYQALYILANPSVNELTNARFFWIPDLSYPSLEVGTSWIGASFTEGNWGKLITYFSLPVVMLITQMLLQKMSQPRKDPNGGAPDAQTRMMGQMMLFMPIMFGYITLGLPSGLTLYWTVSNILGMIQQYFITGWGGLADWFAFLRKPEPAPVAIAAAGPEMPTEPERQIKRRKRRK
jgi:YidC/Oxa1 family membrane protein insertase